MMALQNECNQLSAVPGVAGDDLMSYSGPVLLGIIIYFFVRGNQSQLQLNCSLRVVHVIVQIDIYRKSLLWLLLVVSTFKKTNRVFP